jgi:hypothetical protein
MTRNRFDQFSKEFLEELLSPFGTVEKSLEILGTLIDGQNSKRREVKPLREGHLGLL